MSTTVFDIFRDRQNFGTALKAPSHILKVAHLAWQVRRERNRLASFSREELAEMDINPGDAQLEAARSLFDLPKSRMEML